MCDKGDGGKQDDDKDKTGIDRLFDPIVKRYAKLGEEEQKVLAAVYQSTYFMLCLYIGVVMVRAYRAWYFSSPPGGF